MSTGSSGTAEANRPCEGHKSVDLRPHGPCPGTDVPHNEPSCDIGAETFRYPIDPYHRAGQRRARQRVDDAALDGALVTRSGLSGLRQCRLGPDDLEDPSRSFAATRPCGESNSSSCRRGLAERARAQPASPA